MPASFVARNYFLIGVNMEISTHVFFLLQFKSFTRTEYLAQQLRLRAQCGYRS